MDCVPLPDPFYFNKQAVYFRVIAIVTDLAPIFEANGACILQYGYLELSDLKGTHQI